MAPLVFHSHSISAFHERGLEDSYFILGVTVVWLKCGHEKGHTDESEMASGDGVSTTNSRQWSMNSALMKLSGDVVIRIRNGWSVQGKKYPNMHNLSFINRHSNLHKSAYVHPRGTCTYRRRTAWLFSFTSFSSCWASPSSSFLCLCVLLLVINATVYSEFEQGTKISDMKCRKIMCVKVGKNTACLL